MDQNGQPKSIPMDTQTLSMHLQGLRKQNQTMQQMLKSALAQAEQVKQLELKVQDIEEQIQLTDSSNLSDQGQEILLQAQQLMEPLIATLNETAERCQSLEVQQQKLTLEVSNFETQMRTILGMLLAVGIVQAAIWLPLMALVLGWQQQSTLERINGRMND